jgi:hypothetical protein
VADPETDLFAPIPHGQGQTILREALLVADHIAYRLGQLVTVRRLLGAGTTSRLDVETRGRGPARARDGPMRGARFGGPARTMIWAAPTARIGASAVPRDARSAIMIRMTGGRGAPPVHHPPRTGARP